MADSSANAPPGEDSYSSIPPPPPPPPPPARLRSSGHRRSGSSGLMMPPRALSLMERQWSQGSATVLQSPEESPFHRSWVSQSGAGFGSFTASSSSNLHVPDSPFSSSPFSGSPFLSDAYHHSNNTKGGVNATPIASGSGRSYSIGTEGEAYVSNSDLSDGYDESAPNSVLHDAARLTNWDAVLSLCQTEPQHAQYAGPDGWTALHHACNRRCPRADVVEALIRAYPDAMLDLEEKGMTPLHYACRFKAPREAVRLLLHLFPKQGQAAVSRRDKKGRTPLWYAIRYDAPNGVVGLLLQVDPSAVLDEDKDANSPLGLVWTAWAEKTEGRNTLRPFISKSCDDFAVDGVVTPQILMDRMKFKPKLSQNWKDANKLLKAAYGFFTKKSAHDDEEDCNATVKVRTFRILHATAAIKCHPSLFYFAKAVHPEQASQHDVDDLTPNECTALHLAAASPARGEMARVVIGELLELYPEAAMVADSGDGSLPLHIVVENERKLHFQNDGVRQVFEANANAASQTDKRGRFPLHRATRAIAYHASAMEEEGAENTFESRSVIGNLVRAHPQAAASADSDGCLPLHLVAQNGEEWSEECDLIHEAHQAAVRSRARQMDSRLPLHMAAANPKAQASLIGKILDLHPHGARQADANGKLPFHLCCETGKEWKRGVAAVHAAYPNAVNEVEGNERQWTALQMAAACESETSNNSGKLIAELVKLNPEACCRVDRHGRFALHWACASGKEWKTGLKDIFDANPDAMLHADNQGRLPFHVAALRYCKVRQEEEEQDPPPVFNNRSVLRLSIIAVVSRKPPPRPEHTDHVEVLFELIRVQPDILSSAL